MLQLSSEQKKEYQDALIDIFFDDGLIYVKDNPNFNNDAIEEALRKTFGYYFLQHLINLAERILPEQSQINELWNETLDDPQVEQFNIVMWKEGIVQSADYANNTLPRLRELAGYKDDGTGCFRETPRDVSRAILDLRLEDIASILDELFYMLRDWPEDD